MRIFHNVILITTCLNFFKHLFSLFKMFLKIINNIDKNVKKFEVKLKIQMFYYRIYSVTLDKDTKVHKQYR